MSERSMSMALCLTATMSLLAEHYKRNPGVGEGAYTFVPLLSTILVLMPNLAIHVAIMRPAGPAPTMRTSTCECEA